MQLFFSELIFPSGFLPWGAMTLRLIGRIACMTEGGLRSAAHSHLPCTEWHDRSDILKGARQAYPVKCAQNNVTLLFFPDFSPATAIRRKAFGPVLKKMTALGLQPFLIYPAVIKLRHKGEQRSFDSPQKAEDLSVPCLSRSPMPPLFGGRTGGAAAAVYGRGVTAGMDLALAAQKGMIAGWPWMLAKPIFAFSSLILGYVLIYPVQRSLCW